MEWYYSCDIDVANMNNEYLEMLIDQFSFCYKHKEMIEWSVIMKCTINIYLLYMIIVRLGMHEWIQEV